MTVTHPDQPLGIATLKEHDPLDLPLWWDGNKTMEGKFPSRAYLYSYRGPQHNMPEIGPASYVVLVDGIWYYYFDSDIGGARDTPEEVAIDLLEMDMEMMTDLKFTKTPITYKYNMEVGSYTKIDKTLQSA